METKWTPGPWEVELRDGLVFVEVTENDDERQWIGAECRGPSAESNARLIAAAPDLAEACNPGLLKRAALYLDELNPTLADELSRHEQLARAALAKAGL